MAKFYIWCKEPLGFAHVISKFGHGKKLMNYCCMLFTWWLKIRLVHVYTPPSNHSKWTTSCVLVGAHVAFYISPMPKHSTALKANQPTQAIMKYCKLEILLKYQWLEIISKAEIQNRYLYTHVYLQQHYPRQPKGSNNVKVHQERNG